MHYFSWFIVLVVAITAAAAGPTGRVVGGDDANSHQFPYQISLQIVATNGKVDHYCGGSLIRDPASNKSSRFILTAAHCYLDFGSSDKYVQVVAGDYNFAEISGSEETRQVAEFEVHEKYEFKPGPHDVAVVKVDAPFEFNDAIQPIDLPTAKEVPIGEVTISGWGSMSTSYQPEYPDVLQTATLPIIANSKCQDLWSSDGGPVHETNVCAGDLDGSRAVCSADSGGPLAQGNVQVGIVSWGAIPCGVKNRPGVFCQVSEYIDWINQKLKTLQ